MPKTHILVFEGKTNVVWRKGSAIFEGKDSDERWFQGRESIKITLPQLFKHVKDKVGRGVPKKVKMVLTFETER